jgi:hypothetical protein
MWLNGFCKASINAFIALWASVVSPFDSYKLK